MRRGDIRTGTLDTVTRAPSRRHVAWTVAADLACLVVFVALGRTSHDLHGGPGWFFASRGPAFHVLGTTHW